MIVGITNTPRDYAWGVPGGISALLGHPATDAVEAELWLGSHPGSPSVIVDPAATGGARDLAEWIAADPRSALGDGLDRLPFLLKVLAASAPLSLQAHPTAEQAAEGFAREEAAGIPIDAAERNYKDPYPKPELILAVSDRFAALCGFRSVADTRDVLDRVLARHGGEPAARMRDLRERLSADGDLAAVVEWLVRRGEGVDELVAAVAQLAADDPDLAVQADLAARYPGDPGIVVSLLMNHAELRAGEALFLPAGNIHAYLHGVGVELMEASDNVLRGGLTPKHVDVSELLRVLDTAPRGVPWLPPEVPVPDVRVFRPDDVGFELIEFEGDGPCPLDGPAIALCLAGSFTIAGRTSARIARGDSVYVTPDEGDLVVTGSGRLVVATTAATHDRAD